MDRIVQLTDENGNNIYPIAYTAKGKTGDTGPIGAGAPIGAIFAYTGNVIPDGYFECLGQELSRTAYSELFEVIGTTYGSGDGTTTFNLPDIKGKTITGQDSNDTDFDNLGDTGGEKEHTLIAGELPKIQGTLPHIAYGEHKLTGVFSLNYGGSSYNEGASSSTSNNARYLMSFGNNQPHNNLSPYVVTKYIIKAKNLAGTIAIVHNAFSDSSTDTYSAEYVNRLVQTQITSDLLYPVGALYETTVQGFDPNSVFTGSWELIKSSPKRELVNSQTVYGEATRSGAGVTNLVGTYGLNLITKLFNHIVIPTGYHKEYLLSGELSSSSGSDVYFELNNIKTDGVITWSNDTMRQAVSSNFFKESDIIIETCFNYTSGTGTNLRLRSSGGDARGYYPTISAFLTSDDTYYTWKRIN